MVGRIIRRFYGYTQKKGEVRRWLPLLTAALLAGCAGVSSSRQPDQPFDASLRITRYPGNSTSFKIESAGGFVLVTDPYQMTEDLTPSLVTVSHTHPDHNDLSRLGGEYRLLAEPGQYEVEGVRVLGLSGQHMRGDPAGSNVIFVFEIDGIRLAQFASQGQIPTEEMFNRIGKVDLLIVQVFESGLFDHRPAKLTAAQAAEIARRLEAKVILPAHGDRFVGPDLAVQLQGSYAQQTGPLLVKASELEGAQEPAVIDLIPTGETPFAGSQEGMNGMIESHPNFASQHVGSRNVEIWLPPGYTADPHRRFPVLYMHDGQNVFNPATSTFGVDWGVDETMERLVAEGKARPAIVVAIWSTENRSSEYMPQRPVERFSVPDGFIRNFGLPASDAYLRFLVEELKPFVDQAYRTLPGREDTFVMGSSMGGLISLYALMEYPDVFGGAGCVSTHWPAGDGVMIEYMKQGLPDSQTHKVYFDYGTETVDRDYEPYQQQADEVMRQAGYTEGESWITLKFPGAEHSEIAWRERVDRPLVFLLGY